MIKHKLP